MFHREFTLPATFDQVELFGLVEPIAPDALKPTLVNSLYMVRPDAEGGTLLLRRCAWHSTPYPPLIGGL